jgi:hypothetical protein
MIFIVAKLLIAICVGIVVKLLLNQQSPAFYSATSLQAFTSLPIYGIIGKTRPCVHRIQNTLFAVTSGAPVLSCFLLLITN